ncbi:TetR/AcrR family transcriptional regulator [Shimazuella kribbensis]|uniref:TetR/AcrR family transcriptional regulator n=1 Tax=Shimazuella kribbensis TaxID=139808 RepID=UPI000421D1AE|nr:TetR/AcrR family transcriptional regulator [Shimazuella kribbensis]
MKQEERRLQTQKLLLDTIKKLILEKGCDAIRMADIMQESGLSKGAIFHYVKSKDELFAWVLQDRLDMINKNFFQQVAQNPNFDQPMLQIAESFSALEDQHDITNQVLMYLLSKAQQPIVENVLTHFYEQSYTNSIEWIKTGQRHSVISKTLDAEKWAEMFVLISFGLRLRSVIPRKENNFDSKDFSLFIQDQLSKK